MVGKEYLARKLAARRSRCQLRYSYYEMKNSVSDLPLVRESSMLWLTASLGWCTKAVDALADRLNFKGWKNDDYDFQQIFDRNNADIFFDNAILSALVTSCSFVYISIGEDGFPRLEVLDGRNATGIIDPATGLLEEGYAILKTDEYDNPIDEAYFIPGATVFFRNGQEPEIIENSAPYPLLVPIVYRPDAKRLFGHSRISRSMMALQDSACRTVKRAEISAEFYSFPQKYVLGTSQDAEAIDKWKATMSTFMEFTKDEEGDRPTLGQFQQASMTPHLDQIKTLASLFAGESGLTLDDLGFVSENPSSAEAIKASHESLKVTAAQAQHTFGRCFLNVGYLAACIRDGVRYDRSNACKTIPLWNPIFEPDSASLSGIGDAVLKMNQAIPGYFDQQAVELLTGIEGGENG